MALAYTPLDIASLGPDVQRALSSGPARMMAARGLAPLPRPGDLLTVLYQLSLDADEAIREAARQSAGALPERLLAGALEDPTIDPRVLDRFAKQVAGRLPLIQRVILNRATADETIAELAGTAGEAEVELIAQNEQRLLAHPAIIGAMFNNPRARMSTVDRAVELAVRNRIQVPDIPAWDELANAVLGRAQESQPAPADADALFAQALSETGSQAPGAAQAAQGAEISAPNQDGAGADAQDRAATAESQPDSAAGRAANPQSIAKMSVPMKIRLATLGNGMARAALVRDPLRIVALAAIKSPRITDMEAAKYAGNSSLSEDVIHYIANRREWTRLYGIKLSLVQNPKTSVQAAMRLMPHLREKDLNTIARSKNVPTAIAAQARKLVLARRKGGGGRG